MTIDNDNIQAIKEDGSIIRKFYSGKTLLITGATNSLGKLVVEKLLRECSDLKIFLLFRTKKNFALQERKTQFFKNVVFEKLKNQQIIDDKVVIIEGDITKENLNLTDADRLTLQQEVQIILHNASTVKHEDNVEITLKVNVLGTKNILNFSNDCKKLEAFMYISTAFAHSPEKDIKDKFYEPAADLKFVQDMLQAERGTNGLTKNAIINAVGEWHDLHLFSRSAAEGLVRDYGKRVGFTCGVFRPSLLISTYNEPIKGWCENIDGPAYICLGTALGCIHVNYMLDFPMDCVPIDMCANALITSTWHLITNMSKDTKQSRVYNYGSSNIKPITLKRFHKLVLSESVLKPPSKQIWSVFNFNTNKLWLFHMMHIIFHLIPAFIACSMKCLKGDLKCKKCCSKEKSEQSTICKSIKKFKSVTFLCNGGWRIHVNEMEAVWNQMNSQDKKAFFCDLRDLDWKDYLANYWSGLRLHLLNDPSSTIEKAKENSKKLNTIHNILTTVIGLFFIFVFSTYLFPLF